MRPLRNLFPVILSLAVPLLANPAAPVKPARDSDELAQRLTRILKDHKVPGMALVITTRQGPVLETGLGLADVAANRPVTPDTLFRIGSISKTFAALAALKLVEEGRLDLNTPVRSLVPAVPFQNRWEATDPVRVVHLLEHTTGWDDLPLKAYAYNDPTPATLAQGLAVGAESRTCRWRPGTRFSYCNSGPAVMAAIVEKITGLRFEDYVEATFFRPIGMPTADYFLTPRTKTLITNLYHADGHTPHPYWNIGLRPAGAINATAHEMGAYLRFFLNRGEAGGTRILSEASLQRMETPTTAQSAQGGLKTGYGLYNYTMQDDRGFVWHGHDGGVEGGLAEMAYLPWQGLGYFFSINASEGRAFQSIGRELKAFLTRDLPAQALPAPVPVPDSTIRQYTGWYRAMNPRNQFTGFLAHLSFAHVTFKGERMTLRPWIGPADTLVSVDGLKFRHAKEGAAVAILLDTPEGPILAGMTTMARISALTAWAEIVVLYLFLATLITVPLFALVWGFRWLFRRMRGVPNLSLRVWPLLAELSLAGVVGIMMITGENAIELLGHRSVWSLGITACTLLFAVFSVVGLWSALRVDRQGMNRWAYAHSLGASITFTIATLFLTWWGVIGYRTWA